LSGNWRATLKDQDTELGNLFSRAAIARSNAWLASSLLCASVACLSSTVLAVELKTECPAVNDAGQRLQSSKLIIHEAIAVDYVSEGALGIFPIYIVQEFRRIEPPLAVGAVFECHYRDGVELRIPVEGTLVRCHAIKAMVTQHTYERTWCTSESEAGFLAK
jgi:hypothetical protein